MSTEFATREQLTNTAAAPREGKTVSEIVSDRTSRDPGAIAVLAGSASLSYGELETRANRLARYLQSMGVGPDVVVGLCLDRSIDQIVCALAILKAGGAYLPMDPAHPAQRLNFILNDARASALVTEEHLAENLSLENGRIISIDRDKDEIARQSPAPLATDTRGEHLAYVIYTSGSTGVPKGVAVTHDNLLNLVDWHQRAFNVTAKDRATYIAGLGFDASVWEVWPYLITGAALHIPDESVRNVPDLLRDWMVAQGITISFAATPMAERLIALSWPRNAALRTLLTGADTLHQFPSPELPFTLVNNYGPTECTVVASSGPVPTEKQAGGLPTIGRPIANVEIYILDENLSQVPAGTAGELFIGGAGVARGYVNQPGLTAERFLPNPFDATPGARMYRTGDLARYLPDGQIAFMGRADDQIKMQGFRIEPGEIAAVLNEQPSVQQSIVVARDLTDGQKSLVAYIVPEPGADLTESELKMALRNRLPDYMVPATFVQLTSLPLSPNGKVDRAALPAVTAENTMRVDEYIAPRTPFEERVAAVVAPLLGLDKISVEDNFFMLGGHSLLGTQVIARLRDMFGVDLSLRTVFNAPTVAGIAEEIERLLLARLESMTEEEAANFLNAQNETAAEGI